MTIKPPDVQDADRKAASAIVALLALDATEGQAALEKLCAAARTWACNQNAPTERNVE